MNIRNIIVGLLLLILIGSILTCFSIPAIAGEDEKRVVATGVAGIQNKNISGARHEAVQDALKLALEQGVGMVMNATSILKNDELMEKIYTNTQGYITSYEIIKEGERGGIYRVKVQAAVKTGALRDTLVKLGIIKDMMDYPRVLILPYANESFAPVSKSVEIILIRDFTDRRFDVVDPDKSRELHKDIGNLLKTDRLENVAVNIGLNHHAEVVVLYDLNTASTEFDGIMEHAPITLRTKAIVSTTAQILTTDDQSVTGVGRTPELAQQNGVSKAAASISDTLMTKITSWWWDYIANGLPYIVTLNTPPKADRIIIDFQEGVESIPGVVSLTERSSGGGITEMMVKYKGPSTQFKREILSSLGPQTGFENLHTVVSKGRFIVMSVQ